MYRFNGLCVVLDVQRVHAEERSCLDHDVTDSWVLIPVKFVGAHVSSGLVRQAEIPRYELVRMCIMRKQRLYSKAQTNIARWPSEISGQVIPARCYPCEPR